MNIAYTFRKVSCDRWGKCLFGQLVDRNFSFLTQHKRYFKSNVLRVQRRWTQRNTGSRRIETLEPSLDGIVIESGTPRGDQLWKPFLFTVGFSTFSISAAAIWQYENVRAKTVNKFHNTFPWFHERKKTGDWRQNINRWWHGLSAGERVFIPLCIANTLVFLAWRVPRFQPSLVKYFCSNPSSRTLCWPMILSVFSHYSGFHIFANMYVLHSFSRIAVANMGQEQFVGFFMAAGVVSSMTSYIHKVVFNKPGLSLGASGAIMAVLGYTCSQYPDLDLNIIFLPFFTFKAASALKVIMGIDAVGVLMGWKVFDHAAHLGGALFGVFWASWGYQNIWLKRKSVVDVWHNIRGQT